MSLPNSEIKEAEADATVEIQKGAPDSSVTKAVKYLLVHAAFIACGVYGVIFGVAWCWNIFVFTFWVAVVVGTLMVFSEETKAKARKRGRSVPAWLDNTIDVSICIGLAATAHFWMAGWWWWQLMCSEIIHMKPDKESAAASVSDRSGSNARGVSTQA